MCPPLAWALVGRTSQLGLEPALTRSSAGVRRSNAGARRSSASIIEKLVDGDKNPVFDPTNSWRTRGVSRSRENGVVGEKGSSGGGGGGRLGAGERQGAGADADGIDDDGEQEGEGERVDACERSERVVSVQDVRVCGSAGG